MLEGFPSPRRVSIDDVLFRSCTLSSFCIQLIGVGTTVAPGAGAPPYFLEFVLC